jgi:organic radical activating enzyme
MTNISRLYDLVGGKVDTLMLLGGEPLLHPDIIEWIQSARRLLPEQKINLTTNGILLADMSEEFWNICHNNNIRILISRYPINIDVDEITSKAKKFNVELHISTYVANGRWRKWILDLDGEQDPLYSFLHCYQANRAVYLIKEKLYPCVCAAYIDRFNKKFKKDLEITENDYLDIYAIDDANTIFEFLTKPIPFCRYCKSKIMALGNWSNKKQTIEGYLSE